MYFIIEKEGQREGQRREKKGTHTRRERLEAERLTNRMKAGKNQVQWQTSGVCLQDRLR
jgi:hypothetical protein